RAPAHPPRPKRTFRRGGRALDHRLERLHLTVLPARPANGRAGTARVRRRPPLAPVRPAPRVSAGRDPAGGTAPPLRDRRGRGRPAARAVRGRKPRVQPAAGRPEQPAPPAPDRAGAGTRAARAVPRAADGRLLV